MRRILIGTVRPSPSAYERFLCHYIGLHSWEWLTATKKRCRRCAAYRHRREDGTWEEPR